MTIEPATLAILDAIRRAQPATRQGLAAECGLSAGRISASVGQLAALGLVREEIVQGGPAGRSAGRPAGRPVGALSLAPGAGWVLGLDIGGQQSRAALSDLGGEVRETLVQQSSVAPDRAVILDEILKLVETTCRQGGLGLGDLAAVGVGVRGIVAGSTGVVLGWPNTPGWASAWNGVNLAQELAGPLGDPLIVVEDSVRAMGISAHRRGPAQGSANFLYVFLGTGVGSALVIEGRPYYGGTGLAGELGHVSVLEDGPWCSCGNRGCLEVLASTTSVMQQVRSRLSESNVLSVLREPFQRGQLTLDALIDAARTGDKVAYQILDEAGTAIGRVIAIAVNLLGPERVVLGGPLVQNDGIVLEAVRRQVRLRALQHIANRTRIIGDDQGEFAGAAGAALMATDALFSSPERIARLLATRTPALG